MERPSLRWLVPKAFRERLAVKLAVSLVVVALVLGALGIGVTLLIREDVSGTVTEKYTSIATQERQTLELWHGNNQEFLQAASTTQDVRSGDRATIRTFLQSQKNGRADRIQNLHYVNRTSGTVEVSTNGDMEGLAFDRIDAPWTELGNRSISGVATTDVYQGNGSDENRPLIAYVTPIDSGTTGQQSRLLVATVRPSSFTEHVQERPDTQTMIVDGDGRVVFAHQPVAFGEYASDEASNAPLARARAAGPSAPGTLRAPASTTVANALGVAPGTDVFVGYDQMAGTDWVVLVHTPASQALGLVADITEFGLLATLLGVGLVAFVGYYLGKDLTDAIERLSGKAKRLAAGEYDVDLSTNRTDDIGRLYGRFERMATALEARERALGAERDRRGALFDNSTDSIVQVDIRGDEPEVVDVNHRFEERFGFECDDVVGESLIDLIVPAEYEGETGTILQAAKHGDPVEREVIRETVDGERAFRFRFVPIRSDGEVNRAFTEGYAVYTDITERRQIRERLEATNRALRGVHEITTDRYSDFEATTGRLLELGCAQFDLDVGILSHIEDGQYEIVDVVDSTGTIADGDVFDLEETVCDITVGSDSADVVSLPDIGATEFERHPAYRNGVAEAYIGTPVVVDGETYGTVNFSSQSPREEGSTESEREFVKLLTQWLGVELERQQRERELEVAEALFENTQDLLFVNEVCEDGDFRMERVNPAFETETGFANEEVQGRDLLAVFGDEEGSAIRENNRECLRRCEPINYEEVVSVPDEKRFWETRLAPVVIDGEVGRIVGSSREITERKQREAKLERQQYLLEQTQKLAHVGGWELDLLTEPPYEGKITDELKRIHGVSADEAWNMEKGIGFYHPDDRPRIREAVEDAIERGEPYDIEARLVTADDDERWVRTTGEPVYDGDDIVSVRGSLQDITERKQHELALESLHDATRELLHTESEDEICDVVVDIAEDITEVPAVGLYVLDSEHSEFVPAVSTAGFVDLCDGTPSLPMGDDQSPAWNALVSGETVPVDGTTIPWSGCNGARQGDNHTTTGEDSTKSRPPPADRIRNGLFVPVGDHGVLAALSPDEGTLDVRTRQLIETLVATAEAAFDRLESEASLRERDEELQARNSRLGRQVRITDILRSIDQTLIDAASREQIQSAVCDRLVESEMVSFAWIGELDPADETIHPVIWAGDSHRYLDTVSLSGSDEPAARTAETGTPTAVTSVADRLRSEPWRTVALEHGFQSVVSVPLRHGDYTYGVLTAYAPEPNTFGDLERSVFVELGETVGNTINAVQTKQALYADSATELKLRFSGGESLLLKLATEADCRVAFDGVSTGGSDEARLFFSVTGADPEAVTAILDRFVVATDSRVIGTYGDGARFEATISDGLLAATLVSQGVSIRTMVAEDGTLDAVIDVPRGTDIRELIQSLEERYQSVELVARRDVERSIGTKADLVESLLGALTRRQREILMTAYYSGFFECPRETTGQEIATMLDVSQPTVNRHLRLAQRSLLDQLFDTESEPSVATA